MIESIRKRLARAADTEHSNSNICVRAACTSGRARCGAGAGCLAIIYEPPSKHATGKRASVAVRERERASERERESESEREKHSFNTSLLTAKKRSCVCVEANRKVDVRLHGKGNSKLPWRKASQPSHVVDVVDYSVGPVGCQ